nr:reverse transcriptase domain-containing protein [Tanacetum cinerariifolium]
MGTLGLTNFGFYLKTSKQRHAQSVVASSSPERVNNTAKIVSDSDENDFLGRRTALVSGVSLVSSTMLGFPKEGLAVVKQGLLAGRIPGLSEPNAEETNETPETSAVLLPKTSFSSESDTIFAVLLTLSGELEATTDCACLCLLIHILTPEIGPGITPRARLTCVALFSGLLSLIEDNAKQWDLILPQAEFAYNRSVNRTAGKSPFKVVYGQNPITPLDLVHVLEIELPDHYNVSATFDVADLSPYKGDSDDKPDWGEKPRYVNRLYQPSRNDHAVDRDDRYRDDPIRSLGSKIKIPEFTGKSNVETWEKKKKLLKAKFLTEKHREEAFLDYHNLSQRNITMEEVINEFDKLRMRCDVVEEEEQVVVRFLGVFKPEVADIVSLQPYWTYTDVSRLALKVEKQIKAKTWGFASRFIPPTRIAPPTASKATTLTTLAADNTRDPIYDTEAKPDLDEPGDELVYHDRREALVIHRVLNVAVSKSVDDNLPDTLLLQPSLLKLPLRGLALRQADKSLGEGVAMLHMVHDVLVVVSLCLEEENLMIRLVKGHFNTSLNGLL